MSEKLKSPLFGEGDREPSAADSLLENVHVSNPSAFEISKPPAEGSIINGSDGNDYRFFKQQGTPKDTVDKLLQNSAREDQVVLYCDTTAQAGEIFKAVRVSDLAERLNPIKPDFRKSPMGNRLFLLLENNDA